MTPAQLAATQNLQLRIQRIYEACRAVNGLIDEHGLEEFGILKLPYFHLGNTVCTIAEAYRINQVVAQLERMAA